MTAREKRKGERAYNLENLSGHPGTLLQDGEITRTHRVRTTPEVQDWFAALTTVERGEMLTVLMQQHQRRN